MRGYVHFPPSQPRQLRTRKSIPQMRHSRFVGSVSVGLLDRRSMTLPSRLAVLPVFLFSTNNLADTRTTASRPACEWRWDCPLRVHSASKWLWSGQDHPPIHRCPCRRFPKVHGRPESPLRLRPRNTVQQRNAPRARSASLLPHHRALARSTGPPWQLARRCRRVAHPAPDRYTPTPLLTRPRPLCARANL